MYICPYCNNPVDKDAAFCNHCGGRFLVPGDEQQYYDQQGDAQQDYTQQDYAQQGYYQQGASEQPYGQYDQQPQQNAQPASQKKKGMQWWHVALIGAAALVVVLIIALGGGSDSGSSNAGTGGNGSSVGSTQTPVQNTEKPAPVKPADSKGLEFVSNGDGTCKWSGIGTCTDAVIVVPEKNGDETVVAVAAEAISREDESVTKVYLPSTVKTVEENGFYRSKTLKEVVLNEGLETIGENGFYECSALEKIEFPSTLQSIGEWAFAHCELLTEVELPEGFTSLGKFCFNGCTAIKKVSIPSTLNNLHFIAEEGGNCGFEFETTSIEEFNYAGQWNYSSLAIGVDEDSPELNIYYYGELVRDNSVMEYPGSYYEISEKSVKAVICALLNKQSVKVNGEVYTMDTQKPQGMYEVPGRMGFTVQEFTDDGQLNLSYTEYSGAKKDILCGSYSYDDATKIYTFSQSGSVDGSQVKVEKAFVNFEDFIWSVDYKSVDGTERYDIFRWIPYSGIIKDFLEEEVEVEEDQLVDLVQKKDDLLADLIAAFRAAGIEVTVDEINGELSLDSSVLFGGDSAELKPEGKAFLNKFLEVYTSVIYSEKYDGFISKTIIEGHTAPAPGITYDGGMRLSVDRAESVKNYCVSSENGVDTAKLAQALDAVGCSISKPVYDSMGKADLPKSRRVSFRFIINLEQ